MTEIKPNQLYTKNGKDFRVHEIRNEQVYGVLYYSKDRGNLDPETSAYEFRRMDIPLFLEEGAELIAEV